PHRGSPNGGHRPAAQARVPGERDEDGASDGARCPHDPGRAHAGRGAEAERVPRVPGQGREGPAMKIGEIVAASVIDGRGAKLHVIQLVDRETKKLSEPQTIPPYFSSCRHATRDDVERIYEVTETSATLGTITGVEPFHVQLDMKKLVEKPFAIFGRTGTGKS